MDWLNGLPEGQFWPMGQIHPVTCLCRAVGLRVVCIFFRDCKTHLQTHIHTPLCDRDHGFMAAKPKIFTLLPFTENILQPLLYQDAPFSFS